ncbi:hypothetical protein [Ancylobacter amanitiformis]|uniref:Protein-disulfide isomerase n=1 Tax=Ancylobacter amanitiformis TaxID=217069 RepID=A0ABU0LN99_9HYPH|nr:hypothetical protein [Ancylobacter amanitiformis]MDQ0510135.1 protein-disulfide isomerase [Ancylobacter amanitiformis]
MNPVAPHTRSRRMSALRRALLLAPVLALVFATAGCETLDKMNPFAEKEKKLPGARQSVFPEGVPGVDYNAAPPQPANSAKYETPAEPAAAPAAASSSSRTPAPLTPQ